MTQWAVCVFDVVNEREAMNETHTVRIKQNELSFILVLLSLISIMIMFTEAMLIPALPTLQVEFNTTATWASWILSIYLIAGAVSTPIFGKLGDTHGKKKLLVICLSLYTLGVIANGFAWNIQSLLAFRALQGLGMGIFPLAYALIRDEFPPGKGRDVDGYHQRDVRRWNGNWSRRRCVDYRKLRMEDDLSCLSFL